MNDLLCDDLLQWIFSPQESEIDGLLSQALDAFEASQVQETESHVDTVTPTSTPAASSSSLRGSACPKRCFAEPKSEEEIAEARAKRIPLKTQQDTKYCMRLWEDWVDHRSSTTGKNIAPLVQLSTPELQHWLTRFILEVRKKNGDEFPPNTLHHICCGIMRHLRWNSCSSVTINITPNKL